MAGGLVNEKPMGFRLTGLGRLGYNGKRGKLRRGLRANSLLQPGRGACGSLQACSGQLTV